MISTTIRKKKVANLYMKMYRLALEGSGSSPFQYEMEGVQLKAEIDLKSIYGLKSATPFKIYLTEQ